MGKKSKRNRVQMQKRESTSRNEFNELFGGQGQEDLTEQLISELIKSGWTEEDLRNPVAMGGKYSRTRNSIIMPPQFG